MKKALLLLLAFGLFALQSTKAQSTATLAADIAPGMDPGMPSYLTAFNGKLYFSASDASFDNELWQYNGSTASRVADINTGGSSSPSNLIVFNSKLYFIADNGTNGGELFVYDGVNTPTLVTDLNPGINNSFISSLAVFNNKLYFNADDGTNGISLWECSTTNVTSIVTGGIGIEPLGLTVYNNVLYFRGNDPTNGLELWKYDGTNPPSMVQDIRSGSIGSFPIGFKVFNNKLYFSADDGVSGGELWQYDGATATLAADIITGAFTSNPSELTTFKNKLYFAANDDINGNELWQFDGTTASMVYDIYPGGQFNSSSPAKLISYRDTLYFNAWDGFSGVEIWKYGGAGAPVMQDLNPGPDPSFMDYPAVLNSKLYFSADNGTTGAELFFINTCFATTSTISPTACGTYTSPSGLIKTASQNFVDVIPNYLGCDSLITINLTISNPPTASLTGATSVCQGATAPTLTFTGSNGTAPYNFTYRINGGTLQTITTASTIATLSASTASAGVYSYTLESVYTSVCGQEQTGTAVITINSLPTANLTGTASVCVGTPSPVLTFTGSNGTAPYTFAYQINGSGFFGVTSTGNIGTLTIPTTATITNTYTLIGVEDANLCQNTLTGTATVNVNPKPVVNLGPDVYLLTPSTQTFNAKNVGATYLWSTASTAQIITPSAVGSYSVTVTNRFGCIAKDTININLTGPTTLFVNDNASGANNGTSWVNAYTNLTTAINNARNGDSIFVAAGTYQPAIGQSFSMKENVKIYGGFAGTESFLHQRNLTLGNISTLQGNGNKVIYNNNNGLTNAAVLNGFTITGGNGISGGGGIHNYKSSPTIINCNIKGNTTSGSSAHGGGIFNELSSPIIINCCISGNTTIAFGGGMYNTTGSSPTIINSSIIGNSASIGSGGIGNFYSSSPTISNCIISGNTANQDANFHSYASYTIKYSLVQGMEADATNHNIDGTKTYDLFVDAANGNFRLKPTAIAVNAGSNTLVPAGITKDLAGNPRTFDVNVDMGAYELQTLQPPLDGVMCVKPGGAGLMNGDGWANAFADLQAAINFSATTTTKIVAVAAGTYTLNAGTSFNMKAGVSMYGGFAGTETHINQRDLSAGHTSVLKGNGESVVYCFSLSTLTVIDGFTITGGGKTTGGHVGGGIINFGSLLRIINCNITNNIAWNGGGISTGEFGSNFTNIINCSITNNSALNDGGGIYTSGSVNSNIINCNISNNSASYGGGIYNIYGDGNIINCTIASNHANNESGGIRIIDDSSPKITNSIVYGNTTDNIWPGISIHNSSSSTIKNSLVQGLGADVTNGNPSGTTNIQNLFIDAANGDLRLGAGSIFSGAINTANEAAIPSYITTDLAGNARKAFAGVDMGCYEFFSSKATNITVSNNPNWEIKNSRNILRDLQITNPEQKDLQTNFSLLQMAIDAAFPGDSIYVEKGIYTPGIDSAFVMKEGVHIFGGFNGTETSFAERDLNAGHTTILRGNGTSVIINDDNGLTNLAELNGFTLENGTGKDVDGLTYGGAIYNYNASPTISNCIIKNNQADYGGAIFNDNNSKPAILRSQLLNNTAYGDGAAVYSNYSSSASITNCLIKGNTASNYGGAVYSNFMSNNKITNSTVINNTAGLDGGALVANSSTISMANSIVLNNSASSNAGVYAFNAGATNITYSLTQDITTGTGNLNGATTYTLFVNEATNNYRLKCGVAVIDAGNNDSIPSNGKTDLAQNSRTYDGTVDLGAYEYGAFSRPKAAKRQTICTNGDIVFKSYISDASGATYLWFKAPNGSNTFTSIASAIKDSLLLSAVAQADSGSRYFVQITNGCGILHSDTMTLKVNKLPVLNFGVDKAVCLNENFALEANNYGEMLWNDGSNNSSLQPLISDEYWLQVTDMNGCVAKDTINIIVNTVDTVVTVNLSTLTVGQTGATSYQWIKSDGVSSYTLVSGETSQSFVATTDGDYAVIVNTAEGCVDTSAYKTIVAANIKENVISKTILGVYPNPTNGELTISASEEMQLIEITDVVGRVIYTEKPIATKYTLNIATEPKGLYFVKVSSKQGTDVIKIIKQ